MILKDQYPGSRKDYPLHKSLLFAATAFAGLFVYSSAASANEWGCQVLLCVSGNWHGTPSCHPPMTKLIAAMKRPGFSWPTCPSASSSPARREPYEDCPSGWSPGSDNQNSDSHGNMPSQSNVCKRSFPTCSHKFSREPQPTGENAIQTSYVHSGRNGNYCHTEQTQARKKRDKPYYIEYTDANGLKQRSWFDL
jgi:hypothetical protein